MASTQVNHSQNTAANNVLAADERWQLVLRVTSSPLFAKAAQLREILLYVSQRWLQDESVSIREQEIACRVLGRRGDFNPAEDNIVRVQISHLRKKLEEYFAAADESEQLEVKIPKGSYVPRFEKRVIVPKPVSLPAPELAAQVPEPIATAVTNTPSRIAQIIPGTGDHRTWLVAAAILLAMVVGIGRYGWLSPSARAAARNSSHNPLSARIFATDQPVSIVVADTNLVVLQNELRTDISIGDYISRDYPENILRSVTDPQKHAFLKGLAFRRFTSLADVNVAARCTELASEFGAKSEILYARNMNARDFEHGNFILIGSRTADPWVSLFEPQLNFVFEKDPTTQSFRFRNKRPLAGEQAVYVPAAQNDSSTMSYVDVALVPNLSKTGYVLLLNAATMDANEAAMRLALDDKLPSALSAVIGSDKRADQSFEIFLRDHAINGVVSSFDVISVRKVS